MPRIGKKVASEHAALCRCSLERGLKFQQTRRVERCATNAMRFPPRQIGLRRVE
jgi:hypothetical protein